MISWWCGVNVISRLRSVVFSVCCCVFAGQGSIPGMCTLRAVHQAVHLLFLGLHILILLWFMGQWYGDEHRGAAIYHMRLTLSHRSRGHYDSPSSFIFSLPSFYLAISSFLVLIIIITVHVPGIMILLGPLFPLHHPPYLGVSSFVVLILPFYHHTRTRISTQDRDISQIRDEVK